MKCPNCGSSNMQPHYDGTFTPDGWICVDCGHVDMSRKAPTVPKMPLVGIKGLRKAWWEKGNATKTGRNELIKSTTRISKVLFLSFIRTSS